MESKRVSFTPSADEEKEFEVRHVKGGKKANPSTTTTDVESSTTLTDLQAQMEVLKAKIAAKADKKAKAAPAATTHATPAPVTATTPAPAPAAKLTTTVPATTSGKAKEKKSVEVTCEGRFCTNSGKHTGPCQNEATHPTRELFETQLATLMPLSVKKPKQKANEVDEEFKKRLEQWKLDNKDFQEAFDKLFESFKKNLKKFGEPKKAQSVMTQEEKKALLKAFNPSCTVAAQ